MEQIQPFGVNKMQNELDIITQRGQTACTASEKKYMKKNETEYEMRLGTSYNDWHCKVYTCRVSD